MTRKRFIKLLMAEGCSRNEAQDLCTWVEECGSYAQAYYKLRRPSKFSEVAKAIKRLDPALHQAISDFSEFADAVLYFPYHAL